MADFIPQPRSDTFNLASSLTPPVTTSERHPVGGGDLHLSFSSLQDGTAVLLERGQTFRMPNNGIVITASNIVIKDCGDATKPKPKIILDSVSGGTSAAKKFFSGFTIKGHRTWIEHATFDALDHGFTDYNCITLATEGRDLNVVTCEVASPTVDSFVQTAKNSEGCRLYKNWIPNGLNTYGIFSGGGSFVEFDGNFVNDSKNESCARFYGNHIRVINNHLVKLPRAAGGIKSVVRNHYGDDHYLANNLFEGPAAQVIVGPIGTDGTHSSAETLTHFVSEHNVYRDIAQFQLNWGVVGGIVRDNTIAWHTPAHCGIEVTHWSDAPSRTSPTVAFDRNIVIASNFIVNPTPGCLYKGRGNTLNGAAV